MVPVVLVVMALLVVTAAMVVGLVTRLAAAAQGLTAVVVTAVMVDRPELPVMAPTALPVMLSL